ncbi:hypothetical protein A6R68_12552, partial [Neotoma lepida]
MAHCVRRRGPAVGRLGLRSSGIWGGHGGLVGLPQNLEPYLQGTPGRSSRASPGFSGRNAFSLELGALTIRNSKHMNTDEFCTICCLKHRALEKALKEKSRRSLIHCSKAPKLTDESMTLVQKRPGKSMRKRGTSGSQNPPNTEASETNAPPPGPQSTTQDLLESEGANVAKASLVNDFEKMFNALKIPVPRDKYTVLVDTEGKEDVQSCAEFTCELKFMIQEYEKQLEKVYMTIKPETDLDLKVQLKELNITAAKDIAAGS